VNAVLDVGRARDEVALEVASSPDSGLVVSSRDSELILAVASEGFV